MTQAEDTPAVYGGLTQDELDRAYDQSHWAPNAETVRARVLAHSRAARDRVMPVNRRYGPAEAQTIDIFAPPEAHRAPVVVLIHGGAWQLSMREGFAGPAEAVVDAGAILAVVGFQCIPDVRLPEMADQIREAIRWLAAHIGDCGGDPDKLHVVGHSSGAHLAGVILTDPSGTLPTLKSGTLVSGMYELEPVMLSSRRHYLKLSPAETAALSPIRRLANVSCPVSVWWGEHDSPEFARQGRTFAQALENAGSLGKAAMLPGRNHFEMFETLEDPAGPVLRWILS